MDQGRRNKLRNVVTQCRKLLEEAVTQVLQGQFGISGSGKKDEVHVEDESSLKLSAEDQGCRRDLVAHMGHIQALGYKAKDALAQLVREIAFTHLNRLCAYKMMEAREVWVGGQRFREAVSRGMKSQGFQFYLADHPEYQRPGNNDGDHAHWQEIAYRHFLGWLGALLSEEIGVLFSPTDPANRLFPPQRVLDEVLSLLNSDELKDIWAEDETIGWVYQYFTPKELRDQVRKESAAPRNSYELAFRNQFFTPRYVVEFLTDNTLGRIWYEMRQGNTSLKDRCRYMVRRPDEVFLSAMAAEGHEHYAEGCGAIAKLLQAGDQASFPAFTADGDDGIQPMIDLAHCVNAYERNGMETFRSWQEPEARVPHEPVQSFTTQELLDYLFMTCRADRHGGDGSVYRERWFVDVANEVRRRAISVRAEDATQEQLLKAPQFVPFRAKKDPREIRILDPACGSGHFLLYCFDLLLTIYEEAYTDPDLGPKLQEVYTTLDALMRDVPRLILAHNLHGIDIDLRATQIAALALWLRCQRVYREMGLKQDRPQITKSNIVCAEPMPGEKEMLKEFLADLQPRLLGHLVEIVFDKMKSAGEAGSLLKIDEELRDAIREARKHWVAEYERAKDRKGRPLLFSQAEMDRAATKTPQPQLFDFAEITDEQFWGEAEGQVLSALRKYAAHATNGGTLTRQLFAEDAERGFAFIDLAQKRFDVVLMNPPFGGSSKPSKAYLEKAYPNSKNDLYAAFIERALAYLQPGGLVGAITSRTGFFVSAFQKWRENVLLKESSITICLDLGIGVLDTAMVETAAYCLRRTDLPSYALFVKLLSEPNKPAKLAQIMGCLQGEAVDDSSLLFAKNPSSFRAIPASPFAYWVSNHTRRLFTHLPPFESEGRKVRGGLKTGDDFRFVRAWWEVPQGATVSGTSDTGPDEFRLQTKNGKRWVSFAKGGPFSPYHCDLHLVVDWLDDGSQSWEFYRQHRQRVGGVVRNPEVYFLPGLTWAYRTHRLCLQELPAGAIISVRGSGIFASLSTLKCWLSLGNSIAVDSIVKLSLGRCGHPQFNPGDLQIVPYPSVNNEDEVRLETLGLENLEAVKRLRAMSEVSRCATLPLVLQVPGSTLERRIKAGLIHAKGIQRTVEANQAEIDRTACKVYGICDTEMDTAALASIDDDSSGEESENDDEAVDQDGIAGEMQHVADLISYVLGCIFGRWDARLTVGPSQACDLPGAFQPLPVCPPGMLQGRNGLSATETPQDYPLRICWDGIVPDDPDDLADIVRRVQEVLELIWTNEVEAIEKEACEILGAKELREYFRKPGKGGFWDDHIARYSKSHRKAPIYWLLQSSKKNYGLWLYYHRLDKDILFKARQNYVEPKIRLEQSRLDSLRSQKTALGAGAKGAKKIDKDIDRQETLLAELKEFADKLERAAKLNFGNPEKLNSDVVYDPHLNDGVVLNIAPLWELVPWKKAKNYWEELLEGKYEWSSMGKLLRKKGLLK